MTETNKINAGPAFSVGLALACRGTRFVGEKLENLAPAEKCTAVRQHPVVVKVVDSVQVSAEILWVVLGFILLLHGAQFKNLFLCSQVLSAFCFGRVKTSVSAIIDDVAKAWEKTSADVDQASVADAKAEPKPDNKHAQKRQSKKDDAKVVDPAELKRKQEEEAETTKKVLKAVDSDKVATAASDIFASLMVCHLIMHASVAQTVVVVHTLVKAAKKRIEGILEFAGLEDMLAWMDVLLSVCLYVVIGLLSLVFPRLVLAMSIAIVGAHLVTEHGLPIAEKLGKIESSECFAGSVKFLALLGGLTAFGTFWQLWALMADSGMAWYFSILYLPAVLAEALISML